MFQQPEHAEDFKLHHRIEHCSAPKNSTTASSDSKITYKTVHPIEDGRGAAPQAPEERPTRPGQSHVRPCSMSGLRGSIVLVYTNQSRRPMPLQDSYFFTLLTSFGCRIPNHEDPRSSVWGSVTEWRVKAKGRIIYNIRRFLEVSY